MTTIPAIHPGEHLAEELNELGMSAAELARHIRVPTNRITQILNHRRAITGDTALRLAHFFDTTPEFWLNLQKSTNSDSPNAKRANTSATFQPSKPAKPPTPNPKQPLPRRARRTE